MAYDPNRSPISLEDKLAGAPSVDPAARYFVVVDGMGAIGKVFMKSPAERASVGERAWVRGFGTDGVFDAPTQTAIAALQAAGWPDWAIIVDYQEGSGGTFVGTFTLPSVSARPSVVAPLLSGAQVGSFSLPSISAQPSVSPPALAGLSGGVFTLPAVAARPTVAAPLLSGVQVGSFVLPSVSAQPSVAPPTLLGVQTGVGQFAFPAVAAQPLVAPPTLVGVQLGAFALPAVSTRPTVVAPTLVGVQIGAFALSAVSTRPTVVVPVLTGVTASDTTAPSVTAFTIATRSPQYQTVDVSSFTATDAVGVTGYLITESSTPPAAGAAGWSGSAASTYTTAATSGTVTLYPWVKDAAGNVGGGSPTRSFTAAVDGTPFTVNGYSSIGVSNDYATIDTGTQAIDISGTIKIDYFTQGYGPDEFPLPYGTDPGGEDQVQIHLVVDSVEYATGVNVNTSGETRTLVGPTVSSGSHNIRVYISWLNDGSYTDVDVFNFRSV